MKCILAEKIEMTQVFLPDGRVVPVTLVKAGPCVVTQVKRVETDGYTALQLGFAPTKRLRKPQVGHLKKLPLFRYMREFRTEDVSNFHTGDTLEATTFTSGDIVHVTGTSKGKGFQGVVKRHGFAGHPPTHGHKDQERMSGSIGAGGVQHVFKGTRMAGRMGNETVTVKNVQVVEVREGGILALKGAVPGARHALLEICSA